MSLIGNPNQPQTPEDEAAEYKRKTAAATAKHDYISTVDEIANPPSAREMQQKQVQSADEARKAAETKAQDLEQETRDRLQKEADEAAQQAVAEKDKREETERRLQDQHNQMMLDKLEELKTSQKPFSEQAREFFSFAEEAAKTLGFEKPSVQPVSENPQIALEIARLNIEDAHREREFQQQQAKDKREWDLKLIELDDNRDFKKAELAQKARRDEALFTTPQTIGAAIARGLAEREQGGAAPAVSPGPQTHKVRAGVGDAGEIECPLCHKMVGIGPDSVLVNCVSCNSKFDIERVPKEEKPG